VHLTLPNFGPISEIDLEVKKVTIFVGEQGSGKSMVAKWHLFVEFVALV
jgi:predicted ATPase